MVVVDVKVVVLIMLVAISHVMGAETKSVMATAVFQHLTAPGMKYALNK